MAGGGHQDSIEDKFKHHKILLEKDPRNFCRVWTELLYVPIDSYYAWGPLRDFFSEGQEYCIPVRETL